MSVEVGRKAAPRPPTQISRQFVRYAIGFGVGVVVGLAPLLGKLDVPGFDALIDLFPRTMQKVVIPVAGFAMGTIAVVVQFFARERIGRRVVRTLFASVAAAAAVLALVLLILYILSTTQVATTRGEVITFVTGPTRPATCAKCGTLSDAGCISQLSLNPEAVAGCWGDRQVKFYTLLLSLCYLGCMMSFGALVGLLLLQEENASAPTKRRARPSGK